LISRLRDPARNGAIRRTGGVSSLKSEIEAVNTAYAYSDYYRFLRSWVANPLQVAAVAPSGASLARLMTREICAAKGPVLELGPGTGAFTRALLDRGVDESDLTLVEYESDFASLLQLRFPKARVLRMDASRLTDRELFEDANVGAVVSGLPLLCMPPIKVTVILSGAFSYCRPDGAFYQFTYGPRCPVPRAILDALGLQARRIGGTVRNLPPAAVYRIARHCQPEHMHMQAPNPQSDIAVISGSR
jgi:phospholipid N-methyltransferase